jgi:DegV family protein with EDD domain
MDTVILVDASCDLPLDFIQENNVPYIGLMCHLKGRDYEDDFGKTISHKEFYNELQEGEMPTTSQINVYRFMEKFESIIKDNKSIIYLAMSSGLSGTYNSALMAKKALEEKYDNVNIDIIDTASASIGEGIIVYHCCEMLKNGAMREDIINWAESNKLKINHWFLVEDLKHLKNGGRLSTSKATIGTLLNIKPIIYVNKEGKLENVTNVRGRKKAIKYLLDKFKERCLNPSDVVVGISHSDCAEDAEDLKATLVKDYNVKEVIVSQLGLVMGSHCGRGMLALCFLGQER